MHRRRWLWGGAVAALALTIAGGAGAANAASRVDPPMPGNLTWIGSGETTAEYGQQWQLDAIADQALWVNGPWVSTATSAYTPDGYVPAVYNYQLNDTEQQVSVYPATGQPALPVGDYLVSVTLKHEYAEGSSTVATPGKVKIVPAALSIASAIVADPANTRNAVVSVRLAGDYADQFTYLDPTVVGPVGTWSVKVADADGLVVQEFTSEQTAESPQLVTSFYWRDVAAGAYTVTAAFASTGAGASNFAITPLAPFSYTAPESPPGSVSTAPPAPPIEPVSSSSGQTIPAWVLLAAGVVAAALIVIIILQIVSAGRASRPPTPRTTTETAVQP